MSDNGGFVPVVIVGAGPTGIAAATKLAQYGVDCLILDRWDDVYPQPRAVHLDDEIYRVLAGLGIGEEFAAISRPARGLQLRDRNMRVLAQFHRDCGQSANGFPQANMFDQPELEALLRSNLKHYPHAVLRGNAEVIEAVQIGADAAQVAFTDRVSGDEHRVQTRYVLGCDGANSLVRAAIGASMHDLKFQQRWLVVDVASAAELKQGESVHQVCDPHRAATYMRIGDNRYRWEFRLLPDETADDYRTMAALYPLVAPWVEGIAAEDLSVVRVAEYTFRAQLANCWRRGNMFILGDAAHLTPPFIGQGMGAGLRDATNLAWKLAGVVNGWLPNSVLDTYEHERLPHTRYLIRFALAVGTAMTAGGEVGNFLRRAVVPRLHLIPGVRNKILDSATPTLHRSALVVKRPGRRQLAGRLCPNTVLGEGKRLDEVVGDRFAVVTSVPLDPSQQRELSRRGAVVVTARPGTDLGVWLRAGRASAAVVRPDKAVLCAGRNVAQICEAVPIFAPSSPVHADAQSPVGTAGQAADGNGTQIWRRAVRAVKTPGDVPVYRADLYSTAAIRDPYRHYATMRALGPVVWLPKQRLFAVPRFAEVKAVLRDADTFRSGGGVALNTISRTVGRRSFLMLDGAEHDRVRKLSAHRLIPRALRPLQTQIDDLAEETVRTAVANGRVDGVADIALRLPLSVVPDLVGWPEDQREHLVKWAGATFDLLGPFNSLAVRSSGSALSMLAFVHRLARRRNVIPGSMAHEVLQAIEKGAMKQSQLPAVFIDYLAPSIDTTASAIAAALWLFAQNPDQWQILQNDPARIPNAVNEVVRMESAVRAFGRRAERDAEIGGTRIPAGSRVLVMFASANRDERVWSDPDRFDITRDASRQLGFGHGVHACAGQGLARMETEAMLRSLLRHVERIELDGTPELAFNNVIRRFETLPLRLVAKG